MNPSDCCRVAKLGLHKAIASEKVSRPRVGGDIRPRRVQVLCKYIQMSAAALARRQEATEKALAECIDTVASLAAAQAKVL